MFAKTSFLLAVFTAAVQLASAQAPPACLLAAINTQPNPADVKTICGKSSDMNDALNSECGDNTKAAKDAFNAVCKNAGVQVSLSGGPSASGNAAYPSSTVTYTSHYFEPSCSCTKATTLTGTPYAGTGMATATGSSGNQTVATGTAGSSGAGATGSSSGGSSGGSSASGTGSSAASATGGASHVVGFSLGAIAVAGLAVAL